MSYPSYPQDPGQPGENPYPQYPGGPEQPGAPQYPQPQYPQPQYPPTPAYPPQYAQQPYGQQPNPAQYARPAAPVKENNPHAGRALVVGIVTFIIAVVAFFLGYAAAGGVALYGVYRSIRGLITAFGLRTHAGLVSSIFGLLFSILGLLVWLTALGVFDSFLIPLLGG